MEAPLERGEGVGPEGEAGVGDEEGPEEGETDEEVGGEGREERRGA